MTVFVFTGPTLAAAQARQVLDAVYLPPAARGDVYRAAQARPAAIGIVDGYFETVPSVWHKEILWAMREGVHVFGSASMGALRAAELAAFGMQGVGAIFESYQRGELEDDDEVTVAHAPADAGYRPLSTAMVNIRATLAAAERQGVVAPALHAALLRIAKATFYPQRSYQRLLAEAAVAGHGGAELEALRDWLPGGLVDQKRADALAMLRLIGERLAAGLEPKQVRYHFEHTLFWERLAQTAGEAGPGMELGEAGWLVEELLDEARLDPSAYQLARRGAQSARLADALASQQGRRAAPGQVAAAIARFRRARGLHQPETMEQWLDAQGLDAVRFARLLEEEAVVRSAGDWAAPSMAARIVDQLRLDGAYERLRARALHKQQLLEAAGLAEPDLSEIGLTRDQIIGWHFAERGGDIPAETQAYALELGFRDEHFWLRALLREYCYAQLIERSREAR